jgi:hypothetical protein
MAWIKVDQRLARHPKVKRAARTLDVPRATLIGHLVLMWWWAVDYAPDGHIAVGDLDDVTDEADWRGDPAAFAAALQSAGLLDPVDGGWVIHDWHEYGGQATAQARELAAEQGRYGMHVRWHTKRDEVKPGCPWCEGAPAPEVPTNSPPIGGNRQPNSVPITEKSRGDKSREEQKPIVAADGDDTHPANALELVQEQAAPARPPIAQVASYMRDRYPRHPSSGKPYGGGAAAVWQDKWQRLSVDEQRAAIAAVPNYAEACARPDADRPKHLATWLSQRCWEDWQDPAAPPGRNGVRSGDVRHDASMATLRRLSGGTR